MTQAPGEPPLRWWEGVGSPGPAGYALAVLVSLPALAAMAAVVEALTYDAPDPGVTFVAVLVFGAVLALVVAPPGVLVVHLVTLRVRRQWVHVVTTGLVGLAAGWVITRDAEPFVPLLGAAVAVGRAAVVPLVPGVRRRRVERARRRFQQHPPAGVA